MPLILTLVFLLLAGCAGVLPHGPVEPTSNYLLDPELPPPVRSGSGPMVLVSAPRAAPGYASARIAYIQERYRLDYYAYNEWVAPPGEMLAPVLAAALRGSGRFGGVTDDPRGGAADLRLDVQIDQLHQDFRRQPSHATVALTVRAVDLGQGTLLATRTFEAAEPAPSDDAYGGVIAANRALTALLPEITDFAAAQGKRVRRDALPERMPAR